MANLLHSVSINSAAEPVFVALTTQAGLSNWWTQKVRAKPEVGAILEFDFLQGAKNATIAEANGRTNIFLGTVSSGVVALAFMGQVSGMSQAFFVFALVLLPCLFFVGVATFVRVMQTAIEDVTYTRGINRIRHYYVEVGFQIKDYFILPIYDDIAGFRTPGSSPSHLQPFFSTSGMIAVINSAIAAVFAGLLVFALFHRVALESIGVGVLILLVTLWPHLYYQMRQGQRVTEALPVHFPTPGDEALSSME